MTGSIPIPGERLLWNYDGDDDRHYPEVSRLQAWAKDRRFNGYLRKKRDLVRQISALNKARDGAEKFPCGAILCLRTDPITRRVLDFLGSRTALRLILTISDLEACSKYNETTLPAGLILVTGQCLTYEAPGIGRYHKTELELEGSLELFRLKIKDIIFREPANTGWALQEIMLRLEIVILQIILRELELSA